MHCSVKFLVFFLLAGSNLFAQGGIIKGKVTDAINNEPIPFANILVLGAKISLQMKRQS